MVRIYPQASNTIIIITSDGESYLIWDGVGTGLQISLGEDNLHQLLVSGYQGGGIKKEDLGGFRSIQLTQRLK